MSQLLSLNKDEDSTPEGHWQLATAMALARLLKKTKEPSKLLFYPGALCEITSNKDGQYLAKQLAVLCKEDMPNQQQVKDFEPTKVMAAPEGCKCLPNGVITKQRLEELGWRPVSVGPAPVRMHATGGRLQTR